MTLNTYRKNINLHAIIAFFIEVVSLIMCALTQFRFLFARPMENDKMQMLLAVAAVLIAVFQCFYTRNMLRKRVIALLDLDTTEQKISAYYKLMLRGFYVSALSLVAITVICFFVSNNLLVCLELLLLVFSFILLTPSAYRIKSDLQLSADDVKKIYGKKRSK